MRKFLLTVIIFFVSQISSYPQSYGLIFNSHEVAFEKRTSIDLSPKNSLCFTKEFELKFDFNFRPQYKSYFGYIFRIIGNNGKNIDLVYNQSHKSFNVIIDETFSSINFSIDSLKLYKEWNSIDLKFDLKNNKLQSIVNGKLAGTGDLPQNLNCFNFYFGANNSRNFDTKDLPPMQIKDIRISESNQQKYYWPLDELSGDTIYDRINRQAAVIKNPSWKKPRHQNWELLTSFSLNGYCGVAYNPKDDQVYIAGSDSLASYTLKNGENSVDWIPTNHLNLRVGNQAIFDTLSGKLYDVYIDQKKVVSFDPATRTWDGNFEDGKITEFWHANKFISPVDSSLYVAGGYGQFRYKNLIQRYSFKTGKWDEIIPSGDYFLPRFLGALGVDQTGGFAYIIGGFGNKTGDQMLGAGNLYDFVKYNVKDKSFKKIYNLRPPTTRFTFANSLVVDQKSGEFYGLVYPNDSTSSNLQILKAGFGDSVYTLLGNTIPFSFHDVESFIDFYYSPVSRKLIAAELHYSTSESKASRTNVRIYSIDYPPTQGDVVPGKTSRQTRSYLFIYLLAFLFVIAGAYLWLRRFNRKKTLPAREFPVAGEREFFQPLDALSSTHKKKKITSSVFLFGQFQVFDKEGNDITNSFSPLQKELFLLILIYTLWKKRGISSIELDEILWHGKSEKDAKNNRAVNMTKLRTILEKIGNCILAKESGYWQFKFPDDSIYFDYKKYVELYEGLAVKGKESIYSLFDIVKKGSFLYQTEYAWLDNVKSDISNSIINFCMDVIGTLDISKDPELILEITTCVFNFDQLSEDALAYKCKSLVMLKRHTLANNAYLKFRKDYLDIYGTEFTKTFNEIIS